MPDEPRKQCRFQGETIGRNLCPRCKAANSPPVLIRCNYENSYTTLAYCNECKIYRAIP